jgi:hypothetical protein
MLEYLLVEEGQCSMSRNFSDLFCCRQMECLTVIQIDRKILYCFLSLKSE